MQPVFKTYNGEKGQYEIGFESQGIQMVLKGILMELGKQETGSQMACLRTGTLLLTDPNCAAPHNERRNRSTYLRALLCRFSALGRIPETA